MNKIHYEKKHIISDYAHTVLQTAEVIFLVKYREHIWNKHILDIGCGAGRTTAHLKNMSKDYVGLDYSLDMIEFCKKRFDAVRFIHGDVRDMSMLKDEMFDFVLFSYNGLDTVCHEDRLRGLQEIHRVLGQNGLFVFSSHNRNHHNATLPPKMSFSLTPCVQIGNLIKFIKSTYNRLKNKKHERLEKEYSIINDRAHNYALLTYYIDKTSQISQLREVGFEVVEMYDTCGNVLDIDSDDHDSPWIYYVTRKINRRNIQIN
ncbi:MAG: class I SAM-dependent methyltransferase [Candidatus Scalinduaceae bacterium]